MDADDREFVMLTARLTAKETVAEFRKTLNCDQESNRIGAVEQVINNGLKDKTEDNATGIRSLRKFMSWALMSIILLVIGGIAAAIFM